MITIIRNYHYPNFQRPTQLSTLVSWAPKLANFFPKFQKLQIFQTHRFYRPHYSNPFSMFKNNSAQSFRKTRYELIKTMFLIFGPLKFEKKLFFKVFLKKKTKWLPFPEKIIYFLFLFFCKKGLVSNHL